MTLWFVFLLMTAAAVFAVLWPLSRRSSLRGGRDVEVYRDQLNEIARDRTLGLIGEAEAEAARIEVSRRLIAATDVAKPNETSAHIPPLWRRRLTALTALVLLPIGAVALYAALGSPQMPGEPLAARLRDNHEDRSIANMISQVEAHLERNPTDARGYEVLAPVYMRLGRFTDALTARRKLLELKGENAERQADVGEALTAVANGIVTDEAKKTFDRAIALDPNEFKAEFFLGMAAMQDGNRQKAADIWHGMLKRAPADAPWIAMVRQSLAQVEDVSSPSTVAKTPGPSAADVAAAEGMSSQDRNAMIRGMVARLAERLNQNGDDIEGWQRLLRAYLVLGERDKAQAAAKDAKRALARDPEKLRHIEDLIKEMGLQG